MATHTFLIRKSVRNARNEMRARACNGAGVIMDWIMSDDERATARTEVAPTRVGFMLLGGHTCILVASSSHLAYRCAMDAAVRYIDTGSSLPGESVADALEATRADLVAAYGESLLPLEKELQSRTTRSTMKAIADAFG